jgi:hypothetical protein
MDLTTLSDAALTAAVDAQRTVVARVARRGSERALVAALDYHRRLLAEVTRRAGPADLLNPGHEGQPWST